MPSSFWTWADCGTFFTFFCSFTCYNTALSRIYRHSSFPLRAWRSVNTEIFCSCRLLWKTRHKREMIKKEIYCWTRQNPYKISKAIKSHSRTLYRRSFLVFLVKCVLKWRFAVVRSCHGCLSSYWKMFYRLTAHSSDVEWGLRVGSMGLGFEILQYFSNLALN